MSHTVDTRHMVEVIATREPEPHEWQTRSILYHVPSSAPSETAGKDYLVLVDGFDRSKTYYELDEGQRAEVAHQIERSHSADRYDDGDFAHPSERILDVICHPDNIRMLGIRFPNPERANHDTAT